MIHRFWAERLSQGAGIMFDDEAEVICRDELCRLEHVHPPHLFGVGSTETIGPRRGRPAKPWWLKRDPTAYQRPDPRGLTECIRALFNRTERPMAFNAVLNHVRNDYGKVSSRTVHRHLEDLIEDGWLVAMDLNLTYLTYLRAASSWVVDPIAIRDYMIDNYGTRRDQRALVEV